MGFSAGPERFGMSPFVTPAKAGVRGVGSLP